jgi:cytochrome c553
MHRTRSLLFAAALLIAHACVLAQNEAVPAFEKVDSMEARVQGCVTCHGQSGQGTNNGYFPRIAGKPAATFTTSWWPSAMARGSTRR